MLNYKPYKLIPDWHIRFVGGLECVKNYVLNSSYLRKNTILLLFKFQWNLVKDFPDSSKKGFCSHAAFALPKNLKLNWSVSIWFIFPAICKGAELLRPFAAWTSAVGGAIKCVFRFSLSLLFFSPCEQCWQNLFFCYSVWRFAVIWFFSLATLFLKKIRGESF